MISSSIVRVGVCCFSPFRGGMEHNALSLAHLLSTEFETFFLVKKDSFLDGQAKKTLSAAPNCHLHSMQLRFNLDPCFMFHLRSLLKQQKITHLIIFGSSELKGIIPALWDLPIKLYNFHGTTKTHLKTSFFHRLIYRRIAGHLPNSQHVARNILKIMPITADQVHVTPFFFQGNFQDVQFNTDLTKLELLIVARVVKGKGHQLALTLALQLKQRVVPFHLNIVGALEDPLLESELTSFCQQHQLNSQVSFLGHQSHPATFYQQAQVLIFPSEGEGLPNVLIEAFALGCYPFVLNNTVFPEFLEMGFQMGIADKPEDYCSLVLNHLESWKKNPHLFDEAIRENYQLARKIFSKEAILERYRILLK